jgi:signal transduction histidine kinase
VLPLAGGLGLKLKAGTVAALLLLTLVEPARGRAGLPVWALVLLFGAYVALFALIAGRLRLGGGPWVGVLDLPVAALLYFLGPEPAGPLFVLIFLVVVCSTPAMSPRRSVLYTTAAAILVAAIHTTFPAWSANPRGIEDLGARLVLLALGGVGASALARRLAQEQQRARAVRDEADRLAELDRLRDEFISTTSHNLRTPLTSIRAGLGMVQASAGGRLMREEQELLDNARRNAERLTALIQDLLTLSQLEAGTLHLEPEPLDLRTVVADAISAVHPLIREKGQSLEVDLPTPLPIQGDAHHLEQVVVNVLANGYLHTPGGARIAIEGRAEAEGVCLVVRDDGPGVPRHELERIFRRFHQADKTNGGSGLGLAIARRIVELHGGRMWAESEPGEGASFHILLPRYNAGGGTP